MKASAAPGRHLTLDEIVDRVFPADEQPAPVPLHLAACPDCQEKVSQLREGWLLDRGSVGGLVESLPGAFWNSQAVSILTAVASPAASEPRPVVFSFQRSFLRRPALAFGSLAAALALVGVVTYTRLHTKAPVDVARQVARPTAAVPASTSDETDRTDDELLRSIDDILADDGALSSLVPQEVS